MKKPAKQKPWTEMNTEELAAATQRFDMPVAFEETRPLNAAERALWKRASKKVKPRVVKIKLEGALLEQFDQFAKRNNMTLDELVNRSIRSAIAFVD